MWLNESDPLSNRFDDVYGANAAIARQLVNRAINDWEAVITNFNYAEDLDSDPSNNRNNTYNLRVFADATIPGRGRAENVVFSQHRPISGDVRLDDDSQGAGWFFDTTPLDDAEFTAIVNTGTTGTGSAFHASFVDVANENRRDFYRTVVHEIGHALGLVGASSGGEAFDQDSPWMTFIGSDPHPAAGFFDRLYTFHRPVSQGGQFGVTATLTTDGGRHLNENHANDLMNAGRAHDFTGTNRPTTRQLISDFDIMLLADAYGYSVVLPSTFDTAHVTLDSQTGTLLVQGGVTAQGQGQVDNFNIVIDGSDFVVTVNGTTERVAIAHVSQIVIAQNGGNDTQPGLEAIRALVPVNNAQYVVSSNQDVANATVLNDLLVDSSNVIPGRQTQLREAIRDANGTAGAQSIYVPRGIYQLGLLGTGGDAEGDFDITSNVTIIGSGPGDVIIDASPLRATSSDRIFDVKSGGLLSVYCVTLTGGRAPSPTTGSDEQHGGAIQVRSGGTLTLSHSAVVGNEALDNTSNGGAIYFAADAGGFILNSVITKNTANNFTGGVFLATNGVNGTVTVTDTIIANNMAPNHSAPIDGPDVRASIPRQFTSGGNNRLTTGAAGFMNGVNGDYVASQNNPVPTVHYVVTGLSDTFNSANDPTVLSLREAIHAANGIAGPEEIWVPAWRFMLTRESIRVPGAQDTSAEFGDLDVYDSLIIRGVDGATSVAWRAGSANDLVFELLGNYARDTVTQPDGGVQYSVDNLDWVIWRDSQAQTGSNLPADGDDDGDVDAADEAIWLAHYQDDFLTVYGIA